MPAASRPPPGPSPPLSRGLRAQLRALAIAVALLVQCTSATPDKPLTLSKLARPEGERALQRIEAALGALGAHPGREAIAVGLVAWSERGVRLRAAALAPFLPLTRFAELDQRWTLFTGTEPETFRLHVDGQSAGGEWRPLYRAGRPTGSDDEALVRRLQYRRVRGLYNPSLRRGARPEYPGFVRWLSQQLFARHPELDTIRVRVERFRVGEPGSAPTHLAFEHAFEERRQEAP